MDVGSTNQRSFATVEYIYVLIGVERGDVYGIRWDVTDGESWYCYKSHTYLRAYASYSVNTVVRNGYRQYRVIHCINYHQHHWYRLHSHSSTTPRELDVKLIP